MSTKPPQDSESRHADKAIVRLPDGLRDRIAAAAKQNQRSMNAEFVARVLNSFDTGPSPEVALALAKKDVEIASVEARNAAWERDGVECADRVRELLTCLERHLPADQRDAELRAAIEAVRQAAEVLGGYGGDIKRAEAVFRTRMQKSEVARAVWQEAREKAGVSGAMLAIWRQRALKKPETE